MTKRKRSGQDIHPSLLELCNAAELIERIESNPLAVASAPPQSNPLAVASAPPKSNPLAVASVPLQSNPLALASAPPQSNPLAAASVPPQSNPLVVASAPPKSNPLAVASAPPQSNPLAVASAQPQSNPLAVASAPPKSNPLVVASASPQSNPLSTLTQHSQTLADSQLKYLQLDDLKSKNEYHKTLKEIDILFSDNIEENKRLFKSINETTFPSVNELLMTYREQSNKNNAFALLFLINTYEGKFKDLFKNNSSSDKSEIVDRNESMGYVIENFYDKFLPLLRIFDKNTLKSILSLSNKDIAEEVLTSLPILIKSPEYERLKIIFNNDNKAVGSFISMNSNGISKPNLILRLAFKNIDKLERIKDHGYSCEQISKIFTYSRFSLGDQIDSFAENLQSINQIITRSSTDTQVQKENKDFFCSYLSRVSKSYAKLLPLLCQVEFFSIISPQTTLLKEISSTEKFLAIFERNNNNFGVTDKFLESLRGALKETKKYYEKEALINLGDIPRKFCKAKYFYPSRGTISENR